MAGPDVWEIVGGLVGGDIPAGDRIIRATEHLGLSRQQIDADVDAALETLAPLPDLSTSTGNNAPRT